VSEKRLRLQYEGEFAYLRGDFARVIECFRELGDDDAAKLRACPLTIAAAISFKDYPLYKEIETYLKGVVQANSCGDVTAVAELALNTAYVDDKNHMVVAVDVTSQPVDKEQLYNMASQAKDNLEVDTLTVIADKGYYSAYQFAQCEDDGITPIVSKADRSFWAATEAYSKEAFKYDDDRAGYICPEGHFLKPYRMRETIALAGKKRKKSTE